MLESKLQSKMIKLAEENGWYVLKLLSTNKPGIPDLYMYREGRTVFVEVKREGGKPRPLQEYRMKELKEIGVEALVCDSIEKFKELL
jgi:hypothetical protein